MSKDYDGAAGQLTNIHDWLCEDFPYTWDEDGRAAPLSYPDDMVTTYDYHQVGRPIELPTQLSDSYLAVPNPDYLNLSYTYAPQGTVEQEMVHRDDLGRSASSATTTSSVSFESLDRVQQVGVEDLVGSVGTSTSSTWAFVHDDAGAVLQPGDGSTLAYDAAGSLTTRTQGSLLKEVDPWLT